MKEKDTRPILFVYFDIDGTLIPIHTDKVRFNGAVREQDPKPWLKMMNTLKSNYGKKVNLQFRLLTARNYPAPLVFILARLLDLKAINKLTGEEWESKDSKLFAATHLPAEYEPDINIYVSPHSVNPSFQPPCLHWQTSSPPKLIYWMDGLHHAVSYPTVTEDITSAIETQGLTGLLDWEKDTAICQEIIKCTAPSHLSSYSAEGKITFESSLHDSKILPSIHLSPVMPKAIVMKLNSSEPWLQGRKVLGSILIDDQPHAHQPHLFEDQFVISCRKFREHPFASLELLDAVQEVFQELDNKIDEIITYYEETEVTVEKEQKTFPTLSAMPCIERPAKSAWQEVTGGSPRGYAEFTFDFSLINIFLKNLIEINLEFKPINKLQTKIKYDLFAFIEKTYLTLANECPSLFLLPLKSSLNKEVKKIISQREYTLMGLFKDAPRCTLSLDIEALLQENILSKTYRPD